MILLILALALTFVLAAGNVVTAERLFQSPPAQSPPGQPPAPQPQAQPPAQLEQQPPVAQPVDPQAPPPDSPPQEQPPAQPPAQPPTDPQAQPPAPQPADQQPILTPSQPPLPEKSLKPAQADNTDEENGEEAPNLTLDTAELIDTIIVSGAYIWFCCGIIMFLLIPLTLLILYIRGRSKIVQEEEF